MLLRRNSWKIMIIDEENNINMFLWATGHVEEKLKVKYLDEF
jgi:hypothetical protein